MVVTQLWIGGAETVGGALRLRDAVIEDGQDEDGVEDGGDHLEQYLLDEIGPARSRLH